MRVFVVVNQVDEIGFRQTTALLIAALVRKNHDVWLANVDAFSVTALDGQNTVFARAVRMKSSVNFQSEQVASFAKAGPASSLQQIEPGDLILIRTNPGRDIARTQIQESFLHLCVAAQAVGIRVVNSPENLRYFASKSSLVSVAPEFRPSMVVTSDLQQVIDFVNDAPADCVAKPLFGSRGENVIRVSNSTNDVEAILASTFGQTTLVVQQFVDADHPGDKRVIVVDGEILEVDGHIAGIERHPPSDDFRANLHAGGSAHQLTLSEGALAATQHAAKLLHENGIWLAGVDLIGEKIIEFNVFSTGGLYDSIKFSGIPFDEVIVERLLRQA
ncbi:MAG: glutathione synthase [Mariniblastus sp.]|jgi:glutathione synthase